MSTDLELQEALPAVLRRHTADVVAPAELLAAALSGGRRRQRQTRLSIGGATVGVLLVAVAVTVTLSQPARVAGPAREAGPASAAETLLSRPTGGNLADSQSYLDSVVAVWEADRLPNWRFAGQPHVVWAGDTPAGPAAAVAQRGRSERPLDASQRELTTFVGFVGTDTDGRPWLASTSPDVREPLAAFVDSGDSVLLVLDLGYPVDISFGRTYRPDGTVQRAWQPVPFTDGAGVVQSPAGAAPDGVQLRTRAPQPHTLSFAPRGDGPADHRLRWSLPGGARPVWPLHQGAATGWGGAPPTAAAAREALDGGLPRLTETSSQREPPSTWLGYGTTADGSRLVVGERQLDSDPSYVYAVLRSPAGTITVVGRQVDPAAMLPVALPLPAGQGWVVARKGAELSYRTAVGGPWVDVGWNAALLPADGGQVQVARPNSAAEVIDLHR